MNKFQKGLAIASTSVTGLLVSAGGVFAESTPEEDAVSAISDMVDSFGEVIMDGLLVVLPFVALLIGVFFLWRVIRRAVGSSRG